MKELQIIQTKQGMVAVSDEEIKHKDYFITTTNEIDRCAGVRKDGKLYSSTFDGGVLVIESKYCKKIILTEQSFKLDGVAQFELEGISRAEREAELYAEDYFPKEHLMSDEEEVARANRKSNFLNGYKAAQSKYRFTEEDMKAMHYKAWVERELYERGELHKLIGKYPDDWKDMDYEDREEWLCERNIQSLAKPKQLKSIVVDSLESENGIVKPLKYNYE